jgi:hypothetical protein
MTSLTKKGIRTELERLAERYGHEHYLVHHLKKAGLEVDFDTGLESTEFRRAHRIESQRLRHGLGPVTRRSPGSLPYFLPKYVDLQDQIWRRPPEPLSTDFGASNRVISEPPEYRMTRLVLRRMKNDRALRQKYRIRGELEGMRYLSAALRRIGKVAPIVGLGLYPLDVKANVEDQKEGVNRVLLNSPTMRRFMDYYPSPLSSAPEPL